MQVFVLAALAFALVAVLFAVQNIVPVRVAFLAWTFEGSLALVLFVAIIVGAVISMLVSVPSLMKARWAASGLRKQVAALEAELDALRRRSDPVSAQKSMPPAAGGASR
ncbi:MAG: LapA family protein [Actinobacteria bacterium]|nr:LapA family protein [Actinomycetota bacterium]